MHLFNDQGKCFKMLITEYAVKKKVMEKPVKKCYLTEESARKIV